MRKLLIITAMAAGALVAPAQVNSPRADGYTLRGEWMERNSNYLGAIDQLSMASQLDPDASDARKAQYYKAMAAAARGEADAIPQLKAYLAAYPAGGERHVVALTIADCLYDQGLYAEALRDYRKLSENSFDGAHAAIYHLHKGFCLLKVADYDDADREFAALRGSKEYGNAARFYQGYTAYAKRDYKSALKLLSGVDTSTSPGDMADFYLSQIYFNDGDYAKALATARRLLKNPSPAIPADFRAEAKRIAGESLYEQGNDRQAIPYLEEYARSVEQPLPSALYILGASQYREGLYNRAITTLTPVTEEMSSIGQSAYLFIGQSYMMLNNTDAATMAFGKAAQMNFDPEVSETAFYNYAVAKTQGGRVPFGSSVGTFEEFLRRYPRSRYASEVQDYVVNGYLTDNDYDNALRAIEGITEPSEATLKAKQHVLYAIGARDLANGQPRTALSRFQAAKAMADINPRLANECNLWIGQCLYDQGKYDQAANAYLDYIKGPKDNDKNMPLAYYNLGYARFAQKRFTDAATDFNRFINFPGSATPTQMADAYNRLADCQYYEGDFTQAANTYDNALRANPEVGDYPMYQQAMMAGLKRDYTGKINGMRKLMREFPRSGLIPSALLELADAQNSHGDKGGAIATYNQLVERYPTTEQGRQGYLLLAITYIEQGDRERGIKSYKTVIERYPSSQQAQVAVDDLKRIYADMGHLDSFVGYLNGVKGAPQISAEEVETITFQAAEKEYATNGDTSRLEQYVRKYPNGRDASSALEYLAIDASRKGNTAKAMEYATIIVNDYPDSQAAESALLIKAETEYKQGKSEPALASYRQLERRASTPSNLDAARMGILRVNHDLDRHDEVIKIADQMLATSINPNNKDEVSFDRGYAYMSKGNTAKARQDWEPLAKSPSTAIGAMASYHLAQMLFDSGETKKARRQVESLVDSNTSQNYWLARGYILLSDINRKEGKTFEANEYLKVLRENYPGKDADIMQMIDSRLK